MFMNIWRLDQQESFWKSPKPVWMLGVICLYLYGFFRLLFPDIGQDAGTLMGVLGLILVLACGKTLRSTGPLWLLLAAVFVQLLTWCLGYVHHPSWIPDNPQLDRMGKWFLFIGVAWWLGGSTRRTLWLWGLAMLGLILTTLTSDVGILHWQKGLEGRRVDFGIHNAQHGAMYFGTALLGLLAFSRRMLQAGAWSTLRRIAWALALTICVTGVIITQTRAIWLALLIALPAMAIIPLIASNSMFRQPASRKRKMPLVLSGISSIILVIFLGNIFHGTIERRLGAENQVITNLIAGKIDAVDPNSSIGNRVYTWIAASEWIAERPIVGWGGNGRNLAVQETDWLPENTKERYGHLHNTFLEILVAYGALGVLVVATLACWIGRGTWLAWKAGELPGDMALFGASFFAFWITVNQFEAYLSFSSGVYVHNLIVGGLVTHIWRWRVIKDQPSSCDTITRA
ncbi:O-antigen ligase family protein [Halomonas sp. YLGW01]|uniref:O-antigen ligase family protein n=1 Tax=Halomonas sp. YLGW01 TaxID=2773308 RepID=UPI001F5B3645|nr:O-antigen ligase family protein [Halomonas sp. YLGW01]